MAGPKPGQERRRGRSNTSLKNLIHLATADTAPCQGYGESSTASAAEKETCGTGQLAEEAVRSILG
jgi:hypothetical protein